MSPFVLQFETKDYKIYISFPIISLKHLLFLYKPHRPDLHPEHQHDNVKYKATPLVHSVWGPNLITPCARWSELKVFLCVSVQTKLHRFRRIRSFHCLSWVSFLCTISYFLLSSSSLKHLLVNSQRVLNIEGTCMHTHTLQGVRPNEDTWAHTHTHTHTHTPQGFGWLEVVGRNKSVCAALLSLQVVHSIPLWTATLLSSTERCRGGDGEGVVLWWCRVLWVMGLKIHGDR